MIPDSPSEPTYSGSHLDRVPNDHQPTDIPLLNSVKLFPKTLIVFAPSRTGACEFLMNAWDSLMNDVCPQKFCSFWIRSTQNFFLEISSGFTVTLRRQLWYKQNISPNLSVSCGVCQCQCQEGARQPQQIFCFSSDSSLTNVTVWILCYSVNNLSELIHLRKRNAKTEPDVHAQIFQIAEFPTNTVTRTPFLIMLRVYVCVCLCSNKMHSFIFISSRIFVESPNFILKSLWID